MINIDYWSEDRIFKGGILIKPTEKYGSSYVELKLMESIRQSTIESQKKLSSREGKDYSHDIGRMIAIGSTVEIEYPRYYKNSNGHYSTIPTPGEKEVFAYTTPTWKFYRGRPPVDVLEVFNKATTILYGPSDYVPDLDPCAIVAQIIHGSGYDWVLVKEVQQHEPEGTSTRRILLRDYAGEINLISKYRSQLKA